MFTCVWIHLIPQLYADFPTVDTHPNLIRINNKAWFPFIHNCHTYVKVTNVIEYVHRSTLNMTNLNTNTAHKKKDRSRLYVGTSSKTTSLQQLQQMDRNQA